MNGILDVSRPALVAMLLIPILSGAACVQTPADAPATPPAFHPWRYDEDYSYLRDEAARSGAWSEPLKFVPVDDTGDIYLTFGSELRARYESYTHDLWGQGPHADHDYLWLRALPYADLHAGDGFRAFGQLISAFEIGDEAGASPIDEDRVDVLQAFGDVSPAGKEGPTLRAGRQILSYGSERLIGTRYGPNVLLSFDAVKAFGRAGDWRVDALYGKPVSPESGGFDDRESDAERLWMVYATRDIDRRSGTGFDLYGIEYENSEASFNQGDGDERRATVGSRLFGTRNMWDWNFEVMGQWGTFEDDDIGAWSVATDTGYTFQGAPLSPRLGLKADIISGDNDPTDAHLNTFNPLFPKGKYFGEAGLLGPYNLIDVHPSLDLTLSETWQLGFASVFYWRESTGDGIYDNGGNLLRSDGDSGERSIGTQLDAVLDYAPRRGLDVSFSYSLFLPGDFIEDTGPSETVHFVSVEVTFWF